MGSKCLWEPVMCRLLLASISCHCLPLLLAHLLTAPLNPVCLWIMQALDFHSLPPCVSLTSDLSFPLVIGFSQPWPSSYLFISPPSFSATSVCLIIFSFLSCFLLYLSLHTGSYMFLLFFLCSWVWSGLLIFRVIAWQWMVWTGMWYELTKIHDTLWQLCHAVLPCNLVFINLEPNWALQSVL